jgi:hypothetical protein
VHPAFIAFLSQPSGFYGPPTHLGLTSSVRPTWGSNPFVQLCPGAPLESIMVGASQARKEKVAIKQQPVASCLFSARENQSCQVPLSPWYPCHPGPHANRFATTPPKMLHPSR